MQKVALSSTNPSKRINKRTRDITPCQSNFDYCNNKDLINILLQEDIARKAGTDLALKLLNNSDSFLSILAKKTIPELIAIKGMTPAKARILAAAFELGRRKESELLPEGIKISCSEDAARILKPKLRDLQTEHFYTLLLNRQNVVIQLSHISSGGVSATVVDARVIFKSAIENLASGLILCHNHPSGNLEPSDDDKKITAQIKTAGQLLDIKVYDHIIVSHSGYYSFADEGII